MLDMFLKNGVRVLGHCFSFELWNLRFSFFAKKLDTRHSQLHVLGRFRMRYY